MRTLFATLLMIAVMAFAANMPANAGGTDQCTSQTCITLHKGRVHGRLPIACVSIPFVKESSGQVVLFVMRDFNPNDTAEGMEEQLTHALHTYPKVTGPVDDFCLGRARFSGGNWVVLCDEHHKGWITGGSLEYAIRNGRPPDGKRVHIGTHV